MSRLPWNIWKCPISQCPVSHCPFSQNIYFFITLKYLPIYVFLRIAQLPQKLNNWGHFFSSYFLIAQLTMIFNPLNLFIIRNESTETKKITKIFFSFFRLINQIQRQYDCYMIKLANVKQFRVLSMSERTILVKPFWSAKISFFLVLVTLFALKWSKTTSWSIDFPIFYSFQVGHSGMKKVKSSVK